MEEKTLSKQEKLTLKQRKAEAWRKALEDINQREQQRRCETPAQRLQRSLDLVAAARQGRA
jgi:hypothetical protein